MSQYHVIKDFPFREQDCLLAALEDAGVPYEFSEKPLTLYDYHGLRRPEKAEFVVRRKHLETSANDLGFAWDPAAGAYVTIISDYDQGNEARPAMRILNKVRQGYTVAAAIKQARRNGYTVVARTEAKTGAIHLRIAVGQ